MADQPNGEKLRPLEALPQPQLARGANAEPSVRPKIFLKRIGGHWPDSLFGQTVSLPGLSSTAHRSTMVAVVTSFSGLWAPDS